MLRRRRWPRADALLAALLLWGVPLGAARAAADAPASAAAQSSQQLVLAATLDGVATAEPVLVRRRGTALWMRAADLRALGLSVAGDGEVAVAAVPGLEAVIDDGAQTIALTRRRHVQHLRLDPTLQSDAAALTPNGWGMAFNYDVSASRVGRRSAVAGLADAIVYGPGGYFFAGAVVGTARGPGQRRAARLDTGFTTGDPHSTRRTTIGDLISGATETSRPVRLGGVQIATDFALRPDLVTFPVPAIDGTAGVPSTLDLIVNGSRRSAGSVRAGQFAVTDVPVQTGVNTVTVAVRDALGRETRQTVSTYVARTLLRPGLTAFSAEAGLVRTGYATDADRYRDVAGSASLRAGVTERLTAETHLELAGRVGVATAGASLGLGGAGLLSAGFGVSVAARPVQHGGVQVALGYERVSRPVSVAVHYVYHSRGWYDLASDGGAVTRSHSLAATVGVELGSLGTLAATVIDQGRGRVDRPLGRGVAGPVLPATRFGTLTYSVRIAQRLNLVVNGGGDWRARRSGYVSIGALLVLGRRSSGYAGVLARQGGTSANAEWSQVAIEPGDVGYRVSAARGGIDRLAGDLSYQGAAGYYAAQIERTNGVSAGRVSARGAVIVGGDGVLFADRLTDSFAIVDAHGHAGVPIYRDNRRVGVTDRRGKLVVVNLPAYHSTKIALEPVEIDPRFALDVAEWWVRPAARAGVPVRVALRPAYHAVRVVLVDADGAFIPAGSRATVDGGGELPVGLDGELYLEAAAATNRVTVQRRGGGLCVARFAGPPAAKLQPRIGPIACIAARIAAR